MSFAYGHHTNYMNYMNIPYLQMMIEILVILQTDKLVTNFPVSNLQPITLNKD